MVCNSGTPFSMPSAFHWLGTSGSPYKRCVMAAFPWVHHPMLLQYNSIHEIARDVGKLTPRGAFHGVSRTETSNFFFTSWHTDKVLKWSRQIMFVYKENHGAGRGLKSSPNSRGTPENHLEHTSVLWHNGWELLLKHYKSSKGNCTQAASFM